MLLVIDVGNTNTVLGVYDSRGVGRSLADQNGEGEDLGRMGDLFSESLSV